MGELGCKKAELMIEELLDDRLDESERLGLDEHLKRCSSCRGFQRAAMVTRSVLGNQPLSSPPPQAVDRMWDKLQQKLDEEEPALPLRAHRSRKAVLAVAAVAALAAGFAGLSLLWWQGLPTDTEVAPEMASAPEAPPPMEFTQLFLSENGVDEPRPLSVGDRFTTSKNGVDHIRRGEEIELAFGPESDVEVIRAVDDEVSLRLTAGWLVSRVDPGAEDLEVKVETSQGTLHVLGTIFSIEIHEEGVDVRVARGEVAFTSTGDQELTRISAGRGASFPQGRTPEAVDRRVAARDAALLEGRLVEEAPRDRINIEGLFEEAELARRNGQSARAASLYSKIATGDPRGAAGGTALISLGQLSLGPLGQPAQASRAFSAYLSSHRQSLRQEAFVGLMRSQRALGQTSAARRTARRYLDEFPNGRYRAVFEEL